jgi:uncharacterized alkaline shock family protein YloU
VADVVRGAAVACYGVMGVSGPRFWDDLLAFVGRGPSGVRVHLGPPLRVRLHLAVARGVPVAEVARNVDEAVRYALQQALDRDVDELAIHVDRFGTLHASPRGAEESPRQDGADLAETGTR